MVEQIWNSVATEHVFEIPSALGPPPEFESLVLDEERRYLNANAILSTEPADLPAVGVMPAARKQAKTRAARFVVNVLNRYFASEQEFLAHLVRLLNKITLRHDEMGGEIQKLHDAVRSESDRLRQGNAVLHARLEARIEALEQEVRALRTGASAERA